MIPQISPDEARLAFDGATRFIDIRDPQSMALARIRGAVPLTRELLDTFLADTGRDQPLIVYCYHGYSSLDATAFLLEQGFTNVRSLSGGFEHWRSCHPDTVDGAA